MVMSKKDNTHEAFAAIVSFVNDLWEVFGTNKQITPLSLYHRLIEHIKFTDKEAMKKAIVGFDVFVRIYESNIVEEGRLKSLPADTQIPYGSNKKIYLDISRFVAKCSDDTLAAIRSHLLAISAILVPKERNLDELSKSSAAAAAAAAMGGAASGGSGAAFMKNLPIDMSTAEGKFVAGIVQKARGTMDGLDASNPMQAMVGLVQGGVIQDMIGGINEGLSNGQLDIKKMVGSLQGAMTSLIPEEAKPDQEEAVKTKE